MVAPKYANFKPEQWMPKPHIAEVVRVSLENIDNLKLWLNALRIHSTYAKGNQIVLDIWLTTREELTVLVGEYILKDHTGTLHILTEEELLRDYEDMSD